MPLVPVNAGGVVETRLQELTGEVRDMQKLYEQLALGLTRGLTLSREDLKREDGQGAVEYALVVLGIAAVISLAVAGFATQITNFMSAAGAALIALVP
jgi:Flp pilus assembly pilin Flp